MKLAKKSKRQVSVNRVYLSVLGALTGTALLVAMIYGVNTRILNLNAGARSRNLLAGMRGRQGEPGHRLEGQIQQLPSGVPRPGGTGGNSGDNGDNKGKPESHCHRKCEKKCTSEGYDETNNRPTWRECVRQCDRERGCSEESSSVGDGSGSNPLADCQTGVSYNPSEAVTGIFSSCDYLLLSPGEKYCAEDWDCNTQHFPCYSCYLCEDDGTLTGWWAGVCPGN